MTDFVSTNFPQTSPQASRAETAPPQPQQITQAELQRLQQLRQFDQEYRDLRGSLLSRVTDHAPVEPGPLDLQFREVECRSVSFGKLVEVGGQEWAEQIRDRVTPTRSLKLSVIARPASRGSSEASRRSARVDDYSSLM